MGFMDENRLTLYDGLIKTHITNTTVAKEDGKGLSSNDYTTPEKNIVSKLGESEDNNLTFNGKKISAAQMTGATAETDGTSGTVIAPKAGEHDKFLRGDGTWAEASGGTKIPPNAAVSPAIKSGNAKCTITWGDPEDVIADGVILSTWKGTKLVMNETGYPQDENNGTVLIDNKVKDAYVSTGYEVTGLTNGKTYYFKLFPYSTDDIYNYQDTNKLLGNPSLVKLDPCTNMNVTLAMGSATVSWTDPEATKTVDGVTATWAKTVLVYKQGSTAPLSISDGTVVVEESTQNQYSIDGFEVTGLTDGQEYTFALFAVSAEGSSSDAVSASVQLWATLNITTTEETLYGKNVTATNDVSTVTGTFSESGSVTLNIPWIGSTTITATDGTDIGDDAIEITAYMSTYSLQFTFVPDGATVTPVDDVAILLKCAEVKGTGYTTIEEVLADDNAMYEITLHEESMKYLARSTGFADAVCANETFMTYLGSSAYVDTTVLNSDLWVTTISSSNYYELVYDPITVHSSASATISFNGKSFTSDASGNTSKVIPWGTFTFSDSVSGQSFERTINKNTTELYVMPEGSLYWYGNECNWLTGGWEITESSTSVFWSPIYSTKNEISLSNYGKIHYKSDINLISGSLSHAYAKILTSNNDKVIEMHNTDNTNKTFEGQVETSNLSTTGSSKMSFSVGSNTGGTVNVSHRKDTNNLYLQRQYASHVSFYSNLYYLWLE